MRRKLRHRILLLSLGAGVIASVLLVAAFALVGIVPKLIRLREINNTTLARIPCTEGAPNPALVGEQRWCDVSGLLNDPELEHSDYVVTTGTYYFLPQTAQYPNFWLNRLDLNFIRAFRRPTSVTVPTGEVVRLYSQPAESTKGRVEVLLGFTEEAPWTPVKTPAGPREDQFLAEEAEKVALALSGKGERHRGGKPSSNADVLVIADGGTGGVIQWTEDTPGRLPSGEFLTRGSRLYWREGELFLVRIDTTADLVAVSLASVAYFWWLALACALTFLVVCALFYGVCWKWLRAIILTIDRLRISVSDALKRGEGEEIEFKQDSPDRRALVRAVAAFANTDGGTIFVGIDDTGRVEGLGVKTLEEKDRWRQALLNSIREAIRPAPVVYLDFEEVGGALIAKLFVPRGDDPLYSRGGVVYVRKDAETVPAESPEIIRIVEQFAS